MKKNILPILVGVAAIGYVVFQEMAPDLPSFGAPEPVAPNWAAIAAWPAEGAGAVEARPDPNRRITAIVLDDSGSMSADMDAAKQAVVGALRPMADSDRVAVLGLNSGVILGFSDVAAARRKLPKLLRSVRSDGSTPLAPAIKRARTLLADEGAITRGFGNFRLIVTTDGQADAPDSLDSEVARLAEVTPIQLTTIGIGISGSHVLRRQDLGSFVDVSNVGALESALQAAVAENTAFDAVTRFGKAGD